MSVLEALRVFFGLVFVLFVPGFAWSYVFFTGKSIDWIERIALSFGLSIALVPLVTFCLHWLLDMRITLLSTSLVVLSLAGIAAMWVWGRRHSVWASIFTRARSRFRPWKR